MAIERSGSHAGPFGDAVHRNIDPFFSKCDTCDIQDVAPVALCVSSGRAGLRKFGHEIASGLDIRIVSPYSAPIKRRHSPFTKKAWEMNNSEPSIAGGPVTALGSRYATSEVSAATSAGLASGPGPGEEGSSGQAVPFGPCLLWELPSPQEMRFATAAFPTGVVLLAAQVEGRPAGILVNSFTSVSLEPPLVLVNIGRNSPTLKALESAAEWGISILGADQKRQFEALARPAAERFDGLQLAKPEGGGVVLPGAAASFLVRRESKLEAGDHFIFLLRVQRLNRADVEPAVFLNKALHRLPKDAAPTLRLQGQTS
ncbi:flavin reductase family protein [Stenotrophomonas lactitubi]|uniref:flavin reductase family protein n=1 Tax=Stenotrophomonas lactitubi TaxID=2045214 RepID=UPI00320A7D4D